jgi:hypothetical protein
MRPTISIYVAVIFAILIHNRQAIDITGDLLGITGSFLG